MTAESQNGARWHRESFRALKIQSRDHDVSQLWNSDINADKVEQGHHLGGGIGQSYVRDGPAKRKDLRATAHTSWNAWLRTHDSLQDNILVGSKHIALRTLYSVLVLPILQLIT